MRPSGRFWRFTTFALLIIVVLFGTGVGLAAVMEIYVNPTPEKVARGMTLRQVSVGVSVWALHSASATLAPGREGGNNKTTYLRS